MDNAPSFLLNVRQWLLSPSIRRMTDQQVRKYLELLCLSWLETPRATLPADQDELASMLHLSRETWDLIKGPILAKFESDGNGRIFNDRLLREAGFCESKRNAGRAGWTDERREKQAEKAKVLRKVS